MALEAGARVRTTDRRPAGHTRLPAYLQRKNGTVRAFLGEFPLPDENAADPEHARYSSLYTVEFKSGEVWGDNSTERIYADLFEEYLEIAQ